MVVFVTLNICRKLRISSSQWNMSLVSTFWVIWRKVMHTREAPDFLGLHKNMNCAFPLRFIYISTIQEEVNLIKNFNEKLDHRNFGWIPNFDSLHTWMITDSVCSVMRSMISWWFFFHYLLLLEQKFIWVLSPPHVRFCLLYNRMVP